MEDEAVCGSEQAPSIKSDNSDQRCNSEPALHSGLDELIQIASTGDLSYNDLIAK